MKNSSNEIEILSYEGRNVVADFDKDGNVVGSHVEKERGSIGYNLGTGAFSVNNPDGSGVTTTINPMIINAIVGWIKKNINEANEREAREESRMEEEHQLKMKTLKLNHEDAQMRHEIDVLNHEIKMIRLRKEKVEEEIELRKAEEELAKMKK